MHLLAGSVIYLVYGVNHFLVGPGDVRHDDIQALNGPVFAPWLPK
jgi:hypothetical protein